MPQTNPRRLATRIRISIRAEQLARAEIFSGGQDAL